MIETCHKYSFCEWELLKRVSRSEVKGQSHSEVKYTFLQKNVHQLTAVRPLSVRRRYADQRCGVEAELRPATLAVFNCIMLLIHCVHKKHFSITSSNPQRNAVNFGIMVLKQWRLLLLCFSSHLCNACAAECIRLTCLSPSKIENTTSYHCSHQ